MPGTENAYMKIDVSKVPKIKKINLNKVKDRVLLLLNAELFDLSFILP